ncbi:uncharacterized protein LOC122503415 [Leptopilina heterotoma]|uniref:uncharacterized protein LOC122503415 n=1 Tax=Leptopilina heterotoma TaxID=63436 RepID=UPI001CA8FF52|nr:uncharacterized protein LOC122503415 [Leptopilina heterotoma]
MVDVQKDRNVDTSQVQAGSMYQVLDIFEYLSDFKYSKNSSTRKLTFGKEDQTYQCLTTILNFCTQEKLDMTNFLMCSSTPILIDSVVLKILDSKEIKYHFLNFVTAWLDCIKTYELKKSISKLSQDTVKALKSIMPLLLNYTEENSIVYDFIEMVHHYGEKLNNTK